jgi:hypothetical protein
MKKIILLLSILFFTKIIMAQTLVASYPFNGNANDAAGTSNGTVSGATLTTDRFGNANSAYNFNGISNNITGNASSFPVGDRTISLWFNADAGSIATIPAVFSYGGGSCGSSFLMLINNGGSGKYQTQGHCVNNSNEYAYPSAPEANWYQWVVTISGSTIKMYINGILVNTTSTYTSATFVTGKDFGIGALVNPSGVGVYNSPPALNYFKGKLDDVKIYDGAITDSQVFDTYVNDIKNSGSGNSVLFDNTLTQAINVGSGFDQTGSFSFETWVKRTNTNITDLNSQTFMASQLNNGWSIGINQSSPQNRIYISKVGISQVVSTSSITDTKWHHVAVTYNSTLNQVIFYIDGVADAPISYSPGGFNSGGSNYLIGGRNNGVNVDNNLNGALDEIRVWNNAVLTQTEVRDWMCKKINSTHPQYTNLFGYFRLDDGNGTVTGGYNSKFGSFINSPTWQTSGAAIGDASAHDYVNAIKTTNITHPSGENFAVTSTSGSPLGVQVYRVDEQPNTLTGASGVGINNKYFGVFQAGGTSPQYTAVYNYTGNPSVTPAIESQLRLNKRDDNATTSWTLLPDVANEPANTITVTGQSTEYILGRVGGILPIKLLSFDATKKDNEVLVNWVATNEENILQYEVERGKDNNVFMKIATTTAKNTLLLTSYNAKDASPHIGVNYYRLKIIDKENKITYSQVVKIIVDDAGSGITISPNPTNNYIVVNGSTNYTGLQIIDMSGRVIKELNKSVNNKYIVQEIRKGLYFIKLINGTQTKSYKLLIE